MLVRRVAAACIRNRKRDKNCDTVFLLLSDFLLLTDFFLSNSHTLQTQSDRLAKHGVRLSAQSSEAQHCGCADKQHGLKQGFF